MPGHVIAPLNVPFVRASNARAWYEPKNLGQDADRNAIRMMCRAPKSRVTFRAAILPLLGAGRLRAESLH